MDNKLSSDMIAAGIDKSIFGKTLRGISYGIVVVLIMAISMDGFFGLILGLCLGFSIGFMARPFIVKR